MQSIGVDIGKCNSQISVRDEQGVELKNERVPTTKQKLREWFEKEPKSRVLLESCTAVRWIQKVLREAGHEVGIADPSYLPMYVDVKSKRKKTDKRDASLLSMALFKDNWRPAHLRSEQEQKRKSMVDARARLVASRTKHINGVRKTLTQWGEGLPGCSPEKFVVTAAPLVKALDRDLREPLEAELRTLRILNKEVDRLDKRMEKEARATPTIKRLATVPSVGAVTSTTFVATIDDPTRFENQRQVASFLGLAPSEMSSGEKRVVGHITKAGPKYLRSLLVQVAHGILRGKDPDAAHLRAWGERIAARRGKSVAVVALARKLCGVMWAMWKNGTDFDPRYLETGVAA